MDVVKFFGFEVFGCCWGVFGSSFGECGRYGILLQKEGSKIHSDEKPSNLLRFF